ncbi:ribonuclease H2, subunit B [Plectosphaerella plurivora]|uniref:Ribonuclease H2 subunit B n=1 Tax=Plectosphaerella plurivora TaxID=936078 RepID=A0A9P9ADA9_9PEZI|nr:ribonuclease H2, subunit B [Plectosphaerella plurivora]
MARTRTAKATPAPKAEQTETPEVKYTLPEETTEPPKLFVLPTSLSQDALIVSLPNPRYAKPTRYLVCPKNGIFEFTKISAPKTSPRSFLVEPAPGEKAPPEAGAARFHAHVTEGADLFVATAIDPVFLILPGLFGPVTSKSDAKRLFLSSDDHFDALSSTSSDLSEVLRCGNTRASFEARMEAVSDTVDAGDEKMYRLSEKKLTRLILAKAAAMGATSLPPSMEDKFVLKALEAPLLVQHSSAVGAPTPATESVESQTSTAITDSTTSFASEASTAATSANGEEGVTSSMKATPEITTLQRTRVAFSFICASYIPPSIATRLQELLQDTETAGVDFAPLDTYLKDLAKARAEATASRSMTDYSRKRQVDDEEEEARAEKKRKVEAEKKRKANESRGVKNLAKVNTTGMKKMSDFFKKKV